ncbi:MAG: M15 family metallopeptidase [Candidatus Curtissbacteria bacterium]|nr:M15 family metallopeptidase [Candidatus Curtissbacteria bacterium]
MNNPEIEKIKISECGEKPVVLTTDDFALDPMYFNWGLCGEREIKLRKGVLERLKVAKAHLNSLKGCEQWNFKIWDGYRLLTTQKRLYDDYFALLRENHPELSDKVIDEMVQIFVSPPSRDKHFPAPHNTGGAVDLTIIDENFQELKMGSAFDEFNVRSFTAHYEKGFDDIGEMEVEVEQYSEEECLVFQKNRLLFLDVMAQAGFVNYFEEWWHFSYGDQEWALQTKNSHAVYGSIEL